MIFHELKKKGIMCQVAAATAKAASQFNAPTVHGAFGMNISYSKKSEMALGRLKSKIFHN